MKSKLYTLVFLLFVCAKSFAGISVQILTPKANITDTGLLQVKVSVTSTNDIQSVVATILGVQANLSYNSTSKSFIGFIDPTGLPQKLLTLTVTVTDLLGNTGSTSVNFYYAKPPRLTLSWPNAGPGPFVTQPYIHLTASCHSDSGSCIITITDRKTYRILATARNNIDTLVDVSALAIPGYWGMGYFNNNLSVTTTGLRGLKVSDYINYAYEPSPYVQPYHGDSIIHPAATFNNYFTAYRPDEGYDIYNFYCIETINNKHYSLSPNYNNNAIPSIYDQPYLPAEFYAIAYNDKYVYFNNRSDISYLQDISKPDSFMQVTPPQPYVGAYNTNGIDVDTSGNVAMNNFVSVNGNRFVYLNSTNKVLYLHDGTNEVVVDSFLLKKLAAGDKYRKAKINGGYIAYYKAGNLGQRAVWLWDSTTATRRVSIISTEANIFSVNHHGDVIYGNASGAAGNYATYWANRLGVNKFVANLGEYFEYKQQRFLQTAFGFYKLNLDIPGDSLLPITREVKKDSAYSFATRDFDDAFKGPGYVYKVKITGLPKYGALLLNGKAIKVDTVIAHALLPNLSYKPNKSYSGKDTIGWTAYNGAEFVANDTIIELSVVTTLPVQLLNFNGKALGKANQLRWQTAQEVNSNYFNVEKSTDGIHYTSIGNVAARSNSNYTESYEYLDAAPVTGLNYYRLKIVDKDASYGYSQTISIRNTGSYITLAYPNPARSFVNLSFTAARAGRYSFTVYSASGKAVSTNRYTVATGSQNITLPLTGVAGTYVVKVTDAEGNSVTEQKVVKQ